MRILIPAALLLVASAALAQDREVPYWATIKAEKLNMRVGPGQTYPIEWVYHRKGLPVKVIRLHEGYRRIEDQDGAQGWVPARMLSPDRGAVVVGEGLAEIREAPGGGGRLKWRAEPGVVGQLGACDAGWCEFDIDGRAGFVRQDRLWGAGAP